MENSTHSFKETDLKAKLKPKKPWWVGAPEREKRGFFVPFILSERNFLWDLCFISMNSVVIPLSEYTYFYLSKNITSYTLVASF